MVADRRSALAQLDSNEARKAHAHKEQTCESKLRSESLQLTGVHQAGKLKSLERSRSTGQESQAGKLPAEKIRSSRKTESAAKAANENKMAGGREPAQPKES
jgi:hypothetical protein